MRVLLGSGGFRTPERTAVLAEQMRSFFGSIRRLLFVPYAVADHDANLEAMVQRGLNAGYDLDGIHHHADPVAAVRQAEGLFVGGGNTFRLLDGLYRHELLEPIHERVRDGLPYFGVSAGCNVACPTMKTTNDMPIVHPPSFKAIGLVPFQVNAHYVEGQFFVRMGETYVPHFGETARRAHPRVPRDERYAGHWSLGGRRVARRGGERGPDRRPGAGVPQGARGGGRAARRRTGCAAAGVRRRAMAC